MMDEVKVLAELLKMRPRYAAKISQDTPSQDTNSDIR